MILGLMVIFSSCKEDYIPLGVIGGSMKADINGVTFETNSVLATRNPGSTGVGDGFSVEGKGDSGNSVIVLTLYSKSLGNYNLGVSGPGNSIAVYVIQTGATNDSNSGSITIDEIDYSDGGVVRGTFQFVAAGDSIKNGVFEAQFSN